MIRKFVAIFVIFTAVFLLIILIALKYAVEKSRTFLQPAFNKPILNEYSPNTGDLVLVHYRGHGMMGIPVAEHYPTHAGIIWKNEQNEVFVVECTKFSAPALPNILECTMNKERGVRVVPWFEYLNSIDNVMYIRKLQAGVIDKEKFKELIFNWSCQIDFETRIADSMTIDVTIAIGFVIVWPKLANICAKTSGLDKTFKRKNQSFCSEYIVRFLQHLGIVDSNFQEAYKISPASLLQSVGDFDKIVSNKQFAWGPDEMLVRKV